MNYFILVVTLCGVRGQNIRKIFWVLANRAPSA